MVFDNLIFMPINSRNILMKSVSFYLEQFQRYGVLKNVQLFGATLYMLNSKNIKTMHPATKQRLNDINSNNKYVSNTAYTLSSRSLSTFGRSRLNK